MIKPAIALFAAVVLTAHGPVAAEAGRSLNQARSEMNSGAWQGITLIEAKPAPKAEAVAVPASAAATAGAKTPAAAAPAAATAPNAGEADVKAAGPAPVVPAAAAPPPATATPTASERIRGLLGWGEPPTGQKMNEAKRLDSPTIGIPLPTASSAASAAPGSSSR